MPVPIIMPKVGGGILKHNEHIDVLWGLNYTQLFVLFILFVLLIFCFVWIKDVNDRITRGNK